MSAAELFAAIEATALAQHLKVSAWTYPLVNAGHVLGIALLVGAVVPLDLRLLGAWPRVALADAQALLRPVALAGLTLALATGAALFATQARDYAAHEVFLAKIAVLGLALANALLHLHLTRLSRRRQRMAAALSLGLWPSVLLLGRMIGYA